MKYQLMIIDCDRTLLNDNGLVTERTKNTVRDAIRGGVKTVFASGRAFGGIEKIVETIGEKDLFEYFVCFNGGMIVRVTDRKIISENCLTVDDVIRIADSICCNPSSYYVFTSNRLICNGDNPYAVIEATKNRMGVTQGDARQLSEDEKVFKMVLAGEKEWLDKAETRLPEALRRQYNVTRSEPNNLEFMPLRSSKGYALMMLTDMLNIRIQDTISFGDSENDSSMLEMAGMGVAMGNACEKLKAIADDVTDTNNNDGLAKAIEKHVL